MRRKAPHTGTPCVQRGRSAVALVVPADHGHAVGSGKHGSNQAPNSKTTFDAALRVLAIRVRLLDRCSCACSLFASRKKHAVGDFKGFKGKPSRCLLAAVVIRRWHWDVFFNDVGHAFLSGWFRKAPGRSGPRESTPTAQGGKAGGHGVLVFRRWPTCSADSVSAQARTTQGAGP